MNDVPTNIVLPVRLWEEAKDQEELKQLVVNYIKKNYPDYKVKSIKNGMAICYRK